MKIKISLLIFFIFTSFFLSGQKYWYLVDTTQLINWDTFELEPAVDFANLRIDVKLTLDRQTTMVPGPGAMTYGIGTNSGIKIGLKKSGYHPLCINIGNGIYYDMKENISFFLPGILNLNYESDFEIEEPDGQKHSNFHLWKNGKYSVRSTRKRKPAEEFTAELDTANNQVLIKRNNLTIRTIKILEDGYQLFSKKKKRITALKKLNNKIEITKTKYSDSPHKINSSALWLNDYETFRIEGKFLVLGENRLVRTKNTILVLRGNRVLSRLVVTKSAVQIFKKEILIATYYSL